MEVDDNIGLKYNWYCYYDRHDDHDRHDDRSDLPNEDDRHETAT